MNAEHEMSTADGLGAGPGRFAYHQLQADAIGAAQALYVERGYEHVAAIAAATELVCRASGAGWAGEYLEHDGVIARYTFTGYSVGTA